MPHHTPTVEEITHKFAGATVFSKLDAKSGYWSIPLEEKSQLLTTFNSPFGRFCFKRLPFGLKTSQDVFQQAMDQILDGLVGIVAIADDIVVFGKDDYEHDCNMHKLMTRAQQKGLVFNSSKCKIKEESIPFFGNIYSKHGVKPDSNKVQAIRDLSTPQNVKDLQSFLGMVNYLATYIPKISLMTAPLRQLLQKDSDFKWFSEHQKAFENIKKMICSASTLSYFNPNLPVILQVDASKESLGAALLQNDKPIAYASKSLSDIEGRYANIERELLACVFAAERFHTYVYGKHFLIQSDHRPLEMISKKNLTAAPARLQRMLMRLQKYDYEIKYKPGREMILADSLSRLPKHGKEEEINLNVTVCFVQFSTPRLSKLREATIKDEELTFLMKYILQGFPERQRDVHRDIRKFWSYRDELSIEDGLILKGKQVVIPKSLQDDYLKNIHEGHQGVTRCQQRAKSSVYWPGINKDIETIISKCTLCQKYQASQQKEPLDPILPDVPNVPWHTIGTDLFSLDGETYLIIADYFSKYPLIETLGKNCSSENVARLTSKIFSMFGVPTKIISDNGPQFQGAAYQQMTKNYGILHITSSPHHPKSQGFIERNIRTVKSLIRKSPKETDIALLNFRTTPPNANSLSPAELLFGRKIQANLPIHTSCMLDDFQRQRINERQEKSLNHHNLHSKELSDLKINQPVFFQDVARKSWFPGIITGIGPEPRSYTIQCLTTKRYLRRNRILIRPRCVTFKDDYGNVFNDIPFEIDNDVKSNTEVHTPQQINKSQVISPTPTIDKELNLQNNSKNSPSSKTEIVTVPRSRRTVKPTRRLIEEI